MNPLFKTHLLNDVGIAKARAIAEAFDKLTTTLEVETAGGDPRCLALMRTNLEQAGFYSKKAMAVLPENQKVE
jgi:hypothetical protein